MSQTVLGVIFGGLNNFARLGWALLSAVVASVAGVCPVSADMADLHEHSYRSGADGLVHGDEDGSARGIYPVSVVCEMAASSA